MSDPTLHRALTRALARLNQARESAGKEADPVAGALLRYEAFENEIRSTLINFAPPPDPLYRCKRRKPDGSIVDGCGQTLPLSKLGGSSKCPCGGFFRSVGT